jgi:hypothetical protein
MPAPKKTSPINPFPVFVQIKKVSGIHHPWSLVAARILLFSLFFASMIKVKHSFSKVFSFKISSIPSQNLNVRQNSCLRYHASIRGNISNGLFPIKQMRFPAVIRNHALQFLLKPYFTTGNCSSLPPPHPSILIPALYQPTACFIITS